MRHDVEFPGHGGTVLRGWLYLPERSAGARLPGVVMAHGFSATKEMGLDGYARVLCEGGLAVLVYDHRNLGASDGEPRQLVNPWAQARDYRHALTWLAARPEIDPGRLGVWGSSYSGGQVLVVGAVDDRVRAVVANVPFAGTATEVDDSGPRFAALREALLDESGRGPADAGGEPVGPLAVVDEPGNELPVFLSQEESAAWFLETGRRPGSRWENRIWLRGAFGSAPAFDPGVAVAHLRVPVLFVVATDDRLAATEVTLASYERANEPRQLEMIVGHHFAPYDGEALERAGAVTRDFLLRWL
jgi:uncharacterized protein